MSVRWCPSATTALLVGTTTNDNAAAGRLGEYIVSTIPTGSAVPLTNNTPANITSISLTAGDWDVNISADFNIASATVTEMQGGISLTSNTMPTQPGGGGLGPDASGNNQTPYTTASLNNLDVDVGPVRVSIAATTTVYLVAMALFSVGTVAAFGTIRARRVR